MQQPTLNPRIRGSSPWRGTRSTSQFRFLSWDFAFSILELVEPLDAPSVRMVQAWSRVRSDCVPELDVRALTSARPPVDFRPAGSGASGPCEVNGPEPGPGESCLSCGKRRRAVAFALGNVGQGPGPSPALTRLRGRHAEAKVVRRHHVNYDWRIGTHGYLHRRCCKYIMVKMPDRFR
jgi:hypothetical protein